MMDALLRWRSEFPILTDTTYMISNSLGAMPRAVYDSLQEYAETWARRGVRAWGEGWWEMPVDLGDSIASLIGAEVGQISMHPNVTIAENVILSCFDFRGPRNKVVTTDMNFPSVLYLYQQQLPPEARLEIVHSDDGISIDLEKLLNAIDETTLLVPISHVLFKSAYVQDVAAIVTHAHQMGAMVILDAYQSVGIMPVDVKALDVDILVGGVLKWLCGGPGGAFLYVRPDLAARLAPRFTGWVAHPQSFAFDPGPMQYRDDAFRFLNGTPAIPALFAARPGLEIMNQLDLAAVRAKSLHQTERLIALADERGYGVTVARAAKHRGGTVAFDVPHAYEVSRALNAREILVDFRPGAGIRVSPHFYTLDEECDQVIEEIDDILTTGVWRDFSTSRDYVT